MFNKNKKVRLYCPSVQIWQRRYNIAQEGTEQMAMLKTDEKTHERFMLYESKRHVETGKRRTVTETLNELLDFAEKSNGDEKK